MKKLLYAAVVLLYFSACAPEKFETVKIGNLYSLDVPSYMKKANDLNKIATLQYSDPSDEFYVVVLSENIHTVKQSFIKDNVISQYSNDLRGYTKFLVDKMLKRAESYTMSPLKEEKINGLDAITFEIDAVMDDMKAYFRKAFIKGESHYYQVASWTLIKKKSIYEKTMDKIIHSFKEL